ncbi:MAG: DEDDh family exonuclease [Mycobacteriaceae bacterium]
MGLHSAGVDKRWVVVDVETSGMYPPEARIISIAALALDGKGEVERVFSSLLNPGVDPGPTHIHGLTAEMLDDKPQFVDIFDDLAELLSNRILVAHNAAFDYKFLTSEAELVDKALPTKEIMCTLELTRRLSLGFPNLKLETLAAQWNIQQNRAHDAYDDALVLSRVLVKALARAQELGTWLPVRECSQKTWPNGRVTHDEPRSMKALVSRIPCQWVNPGPYIAGRPLAQGMRIALSAEVERTHEELIERMLAAGLHYVDSVTADASLVVCNTQRPTQGKGVVALRLGIPLISDVYFLELLDRVVSGYPIEQFKDSAIDNTGQGTLF